MGLDTSHDCWHGAYSAFSRFRIALTRAAGYETVFWDEDGRHQSKPEPGRGFVHETVAVPGEMFTDARLEGDWGDDPPEDPLFVLLIHSDCDGLIPHKFCELLARRLEQLAPKMDDFGVGHLSSPQHAALKFARGLRSAAEAGEDVEFG